MTLTAQQQLIFGAMCIDEDFRLQLFAAGEFAPAERRARIAALIQGYANDNDAPIDDSVADNVMNVVAFESACRVAAKHGYEAVKAAACPCWPCD